MALNCSDVTAAAIDEEVVAILKESYEKALEMLRENREVMDKLAEYLIEKETITGKEFMSIFRKEKGIPEPEEEKKDEAKPEETVAEEVPQVTVELKDADEAFKPVIDVVVSEDSVKATEESVSEGTPEEETSAEEPTQAPEQDNRPVGRFSNGKID